MKNLSILLNRGNLTPRERYLMLIQNDVNRARTGKNILTKADQDALENWKAQNNWEAEEWNKLNDAWKHTGRMEIEAELVYKDAQVAYMTQLPTILKLLYYPSFYRMSKSIKTLENIKCVNINGAINIVTKQKAVKLKDGMDFDYAIYQLAFELLNEDDRKRMKELYEDIETEHQYLDQEEIIANLLGKNMTLSQEAKEKIASLVAEHAYNKFAGEYQLYHYFACIPILRVAKCFLDIKGIEIKKSSKSDDGEVGEQQEDTYDLIKGAMESYSVKHGVSVGEMLKEACLKWLDAGLFDTYTPLVISTDADLFHRWLEKREEARKILIGYINSDKLKLETRDEKTTRRSKLYSKHLYDAELKNARSMIEKMGMEVTEKFELDEKIAFENFNESIITGESLYKLNEGHEFIQDYKERIDEYEPNLGVVYAEDDPDQKGEHLDRELLICNINKDGKPNFFSPYGMSINILSGLFDGINLFREEIIDGINVLKFEDGFLKNIFIEKCKELTDGYAKMLAFEGILKRLSKVYEVDLTYHIADRVKMLKSYIDEVNRAIRQATNNDEEDTPEDKWGILKRRDKLIFKDFELIDTDLIKPDLKFVEEHEQKFENILGKI